jgi:hypothetical protein
VAPVRFADVWQTKDFKSSENESVAVKGLAEVFCRSVAMKGVSAGLAQKSEAD